MADTNLNRRRILAGALALASPLAAVPALAAVSAGSHPDAALLDLGRRFDAARLAWEARRPAYRAASAAIGANIEAWRERQAVATREGRDNSEETYRQIFLEANPTDEIGRGNAFLEEHVDPLTEAILRAPPPTTLAGLAVKARALTWTPPKTSQSAVSASAKPLK